MSMELNMQLMAMYRQTVSGNQAWAKRLGHYARLGQLAASINEPGNRVFISFDVQGESDRMQVALEDYTAYMAELRQDLMVNVVPSHASPLLQDLELLNDSVAEMVQEIELLYAFLQQQPEKSRRHLARVNDLLSDVRMMLDTLRTDVRLIQHQLFEEQLVAATALKTYRNMIALCVLFAAGGVAVYGQLLARRMERDRQEKDQYLKDLHYAEARMRTIVDGAADGIITLDAHGRIASYNRAAHQLFGYTAEEASGTTITACVDRPSAAVLAHAIQIPCLLEHQEVAGRRYELVGQRKDGSTFPLDLHLSEVQVGDQWMFTAIVSDITARKRVEQLRMEKEAAEAANRAKSEFLANMSHELRTPLHGILGFARRGLKKAPTTSPARLQDYFAQIAQSGNVLLTLLNDLLDLAKLEAGRMTFSFEPTPLPPLLAQASDEFSSLVSEQHLRVALQQPTETPTVGLDAGKIMQVLRNLLSNAVKFSPPGGTITLSLQPESEAVVVRVEDEGVGIPEAEIETIFDKFVQSSTTKTGAGGTGLGLAICREIVMAHRGRIWAANRPGGGAVFAFALPLVASDELPPTLVAVGSPGAQQPGAAPYQDHYGVGQSHGGEDPSPPWRRGDLWKTE